MKRELCRQVIARVGSTATVLLMGIAAAGCAGSERPVPDNLVVVSIQPQAWLVERVAGETVEVATLLSPGDSPATYQPTDTQISRVLQAAAYFRIGVPFEEGEWFRAIASSRRIRIIDTREGITLRPIETGHSHEHEAESGQAHEHEAESEHSGEAGTDHVHSAGGLDPHIWLSPRLLAIQARTVARALGEIFPEHQETFTANLAALETALDSLDRELAALLAPVRGRTIFLFHPSWGYFADDYGLHQMPIEIEGKEPSDAELTAFQQLARSEGIRVIFIQPQITSHTADILAAALDAEVRLLDPLARDVMLNLRSTAELLAGALR